MNSGSFSPAAYEQREIVERKTAGTFGAFLFALAGGVVYFLLYQLGYLAGLSGLVAVVCALQGYRILAKKESTYGVVASVVSAVLVICLAWYACLAKDVYDAYIAWEAAGEISYSLTYWESVRVAYLYLKGETATSYFTDLAIGLVLCAAGCFTTVRAAAKRTKAAQDAAADGYPVQPAAPDATVPDAAGDSSDSTKSAESTES